MTPGRFDVPPPDAMTVQMHRLILERMRFASRTAVTGHMFASTDVRVWMDHMCDQLVVELRAEVLAERVGRDDVRIPVTHDTTHDAALRGAWGMWVAASAIGVACIAFLSPWAALACAVLLAAMTIDADLQGWLTRTERQTWTGHVDVHRDLWRMFPEATIVYPPDLGRPIERAIQSSPVTFWNPDADPDPDA